MMNRTKALVMGSALLACAALLGASSGYAQTDVFSSNGGSAGATTGGAYNVNPSLPYNSYGAPNTTARTGTQAIIPGNTGCGNQYGCANTTARTGTQTPGTLPGSVQQYAPLQGQVQQQAPLRGGVQQPAPPLQGQVQSPGTQPSPLQGRVQQSAPLQGNIRQSAPLPGRASTGVPQRGYPSANIPLRGNATGGRVPNWTPGAQSPGMYGGHHGGGIQNVLPGIIGAAPAIAGAINGLMQGITQPFAGTPPAPQYAYPPSYPYYSGGQPAYTSPPPPTNHPAPSYSPLQHKQAKTVAVPLLCKCDEKENWERFPKQDELFNSVRRLAQLVFGRYNTGYPLGIGIVKLRRFGEPAEEVCLVAAAGTEWKFSQSTAALEHWAATFRIHDNYVQVVDQAIKDRCVDKKLILIGHSLGGMELQRMASHHASNVLALIDLGSPRVITRDEAKNVQSYTSFSVIGDVIPGYQGQWDSIGRILADDRPKQCFGPSLSSLIDSHIVHHMYYPCDHALDDYDVLGTKGGTAMLNLEHWYTYSVPEKWGKGEIDSEHSF